MLVLTCKSEERIHVGNDVVITVVKSAGPVRLGIDAPAGVAVDRESVRQSKAADAGEASAAITGAPSSAAELWNGLGETSFNN